MNFNGPSDFTPHLFRFTNLQNQHVGVWCVCLFYGVTPFQGWNWFQNAPLPGATPQATYVRALRAQYFVLSFHNFHQQARPRRGHTRAAQGEALGKKNIRKIKL